MITIRVHDLGRDRPIILRSPWRPWLSAGRHVRLLLNPNSCWGHQARIGKAGSPEAYLFHQGASMPTAGRFLGIDISKTQLDLAVHGTEARQH